MKTFLLILFLHTFFSRDVDVEKYNQLLKSGGDEKDTDVFEFDQYGQINRPVDKERQNKTNEAILQSLKNNKEENKQIDKLKSVYRIIK